jgi:hypothetical protein
MTIIRRHRFKQTVAFKDRCEVFAKDLRQRASNLATGSEREDLLTRARQADTASHLDDWANSGELQPPKAASELSAHEARVVTAYRVYAVDKDGHTASPPHVIECTGDEEAIRLARQFLDGKLIEVWQEARRIARLEPH